MNTQIARVRTSGRFYQITLCLMLVFLSAGNIWGASPENSSVRMAYLQNDIHHLACWTAIEKDFYTQNGVQVEIAGVFRAGPEIMTAFAAGELDMAYVGESPATIAVANKTAKVVAVAQVNTEGSAIVVGRDATDMKTVADLSKKTVAVPGYGTAQDFLLRRALDDKKVDFSSLNIIVLKPPEMISALRSNQIQAFVAWEPYPSKAVTMNIGKRLASSRDMWPGHPCCILAASTDFITKYPEKVRAVVQAHIVATDFIHDQPEEAVQIGMKYTGMDEATVKEATDHVTYTVDLNVPAEAEYVQFLNRLKYVRITDETAFIRSFLDTSWVKGK